jgi:hypothetical protein
MGACLHELGHAFDLLHVTDPQGIMSRGFDRFSRVFVPVEAPHSRKKTPYAFPDNEVARWAPAHAYILKDSRWFALDYREYKDGPRAKGRFDPKSENIIVTSPYGIGGIALGTPDYISAYVPLDLSAPAPRRVDVSLVEYKEVLSKKRALLQVRDTEGNICYLRIDELTAGDKELVESGK